MNKNINLKKLYFNFTAKFFFYSYKLSFKSEFVQKRIDLQSIEKDIKKV
jgi:hypothetical protein